MLELNATIYALIAAGTLIGGVVGFGLQISSLRKAQLEIAELKRKSARAEQENEKLSLELQDLRNKIQLSHLTKEKAELEVSKLRDEERAAASRLVTSLTTEEVIEYGTRFSRSREPAEEPQSSRGRRKHVLPTAALAIAVIAVTVSLALATDFKSLALALIAILSSK